MNVVRFDGVLQLGIGLVCFTQNARHTHVMVYLCMHWERQRGNGTTAKIGWIDIVPVKMKMSESEAQKLDAKSRK